MHNPEQTNAKRCGQQRRFRNRPVFMKTKEHAGNTERRPDNRKQQIARCFRKPDPVKDQAADNAEDHTGRGDF